LAGHDDALDLIGAFVDVSSDEQREQVSAASDFGRGGHV
jgi:hypothetical protein